MCRFILTGAKPLPGQELPYNAPAPRSHAKDPKSDGVARDVPATGNPPAGVPPVGRRPFSLAHLMIFHPPPENAKLISFAAQFLASQSLAAQSLATQFIAAQPPAGNGNTTVAPPVNTEQRFDHSTISESRTLILPCNLLNCGSQWWRCRIR